MCMRFALFLLTASLAVGLDPCDETVECRNDLWPSFSANCWCGGNQFPYYMQCKQCTNPSDESHMCGCYTSPLLGTVKCSKGTCMAAQCPQGQCKWVVPMKDYVEFSYGVKDMAGVLIPNVEAKGVEWSAGCEPCTCLLNQTMTTACDRKVINSKPVCATCPAGFQCDGQLNTERACYADSYCLDGVSTACEANKAQYCTSAGMSAPRVGCEAGSFYSSNLCTACAPGSYLATATAWLAEDGSFQEGGLHTITACTRCPAGTRQSGLDRTRADGCVPCGLGRYTEEAGRTECAFCQAGTYQSNEGGTECISCVAGEYSKFTYQACERCTPGTFSSASKSVECTECAAGSYNSQWGQVECVKCPRDRSTDRMTNDGFESASKTMASDCQFCVEGFVVCDAVKFDTCVEQKCIPCPQGHFCPGENVRQLWTPVPLGSYRVRQGNSTHDSDVRVCSPPCASGRWLRALCTDTADTDCQDCKMAVPLQTRSQTVCGGMHDAVLIECTAEEQLPGAICNPCLAGSMSSNGQCVPCPPKAAECPICAENFMRGPGSAVCTRNCSVSEIAEDGESCQSKTKAAVRDVAWTTRLLSVSGAARFDDSKMLLANNRATAGLLWQVALGAIWLVAADTAFGEITALIARGDGFLVGERNGKIRSLDALMQVQTVATAEAAIGGLCVLPDGLILFTSDNSVWLVSKIMMRRLRGSSLRSTGFAETRGLFSRPTSIATVDDIVVVLDDYGMWTFELSTETTATRGVCGGGTLTTIAVGGTRCSDMLLNNVVSMTTGTVRGSTSVVFATASSVAYFAMGDWWVYLLASAPTDTAYGHVFWGPALYVTASLVNKGVSVIEIGLDDCLCEAGLYCFDGNCVQAPVGTFAPSWSQAPIPCKAGTVSTGAGKRNRSEGCVACPLLWEQTRFTTHFDGAINCEPICNSTTVFNSQTGLCIAGCSPGQYLSAAGVCTTSPWGADSDQKPCAVGTFAFAAGICRPCPEGTTTHFEAADRCMGPLDCPDGSLSCTESIAVTSSATDITSVVALSDGRGYAGSASGLWLDQTQLSTQPYTFGLLALSDDESSLYASGVGGHCIWLRAQTGVLRMLVGQCTQNEAVDGPQAYARFSSIQSLAYMHVEGQTPVLFVSSEAAGCGSIRAVSLFDMSVSTFASYDNLRGNRILFSQCFTNTIGLAVARGSDALYYFGVDNTMIQTRNDGVYAQQVLQSPRVRTACAKQSLIAFSDGDVLNIMSDDNPGFIEELPGKGGQAIACGAGRRILVARGKQFGVVMTSTEACVGGYVMMNGTCMQLGVGQYSRPDGSPAACKGGTYGTRAGAWSHVMCNDCPSGSVAGEGALTCQRCPSNLPLSWIDTCVSFCPGGFYRQNLGCVACPAGMDSVAKGLSLADCRPCAQGYYANASSLGLCKQCPEGWSSRAGSHHCVIMCTPGKCSKRDGEGCIAMTENWEMLTSVQLKGTAMRALTVGRNGLVFYSDGNSISYFRDECKNDASAIAKAKGDACQMQGVVLLASGENPLLVDRAISSLAITKNFVDTELTQRYMYAASTSTHSIYRLIVNFQPSFQGGVSMEQSWFDFVGGPIAGFSDRLFHSPTELELSTDGALLYVSDYGNNRIRIVDTKTRKITTLLGDGRPCWRFGSLPWNSDGQATLPADTCNNYEGSATAQRPMGIGLSRDNTQLYAAMLSEDAVGLVELKAATLTRYCSFLPENIKKTFETCRTDVFNSRSCFLWKPYDVAATEQSLFVAVTNGVTRINLGDLSCEQVSGSLWNWNASSSMGYADGERVNETCATSRVYNPFKLVYSPDNNIMYVADLSNGAVRRIFIAGKCNCPEGSIFIEEARACYNPTQRWGNRVLVQCDAGHFALEGDTTCRSCNDAVVEGLYIASCVMWAENMKISVMAPRCRLITSWG